MIVSACLIGRWRCIAGDGVKSAAVTTKIQRRAVVQGAAWAVPLVIVGSPAQAVAASGCSAKLVITRSGESPDYPLDCYFVNVVRDGVVYTSLPSSADAATLTGLTPGTYQVIFADTAGSVDSFGRFPGCYGEPCSWFGQAVEFSIPEACGTEIPMTLIRMCE